MIEIKNATVFILPEDNQQRSGDKITKAELETLITSASQLMDESVRANFSTRMQSHVGSNSTYALKNTVLQGLKVIYDKLESPDTSESEKKIIAYKLQERAEECTPGFHNGVNAVVDSFYAAKNINDLLSRVRQDIVTRVASQLSDDVHVNNRCFVRAEDLGYGVHALNREDRYLNHLSDVVPNHQIEDALNTAFEKELRVFPMLQGLEDQLRGQLDSAGYEGQKDTPYATDEQAKIETALKQLFKDDPAVRNLEEAQLAMNEQIKEKKELNNNIKQALEHLGFSGNNINTFLTLSDSITLTPMQTALQKQLEARINALSPENKISYETIKADYATENAKFDTSARDRLTEANQAFESKLFVVKKDEHGMNEGITDINWPSIREMLWQGIKEHDYFEFSEHEDIYIDMLMDPHASPKDWGMHEIFETTQELIQAVNYFNPPTQAAEQSLRHHLEQLPENSRYETFTNIIQSLSNRAIKDEFIKIQGSKFLSELKHDIPTLLAIIPFMTSENISECLLDQALRTSLLNHAILEQPRSLPLLLKSMDTLPGNITTEALKHILPDIIISPDDVSQLLRHLPPEQCVTACDALKEKLPNIINARSFGEVLQHLSPEKCSILCNVMKESLPSFLERYIPIYCVFKNLSEEQCTAVFNAMKPQLLNIVKTGSQVSPLMKYLSPDEQIYLFEAIKPELTHLITSGNDFNSVLQYLSKDQRMIVFDMMEAQLPHIITSSNDLRAALEYLSEDQSTIVFNMIEPQLLNMIKDADTFGRTMGRLLPSQYNHVFNKIKAELPHILNSPIAISNSLYYLSLERCSDVVGAIKSEFQNFIKSSEDFNELIKDLKYLENEEKFKLVIDNCEGVLHQAFLDKNVYLFDTLIKHGVKPTPDTFLQICSTDNASIIEVIDALLDKGLVEPQDIISTSSKQNNMSLIQRLFDEGIIRPNRELLTQACNDGDIKAIQILIHNGIIKNTFDFKRVLEDLEPEQRTAVYEAMKKDLPNIIRNGRSLGRALNHLTPEQCTAVCESMKENSPGMIKDINDLVRALKNLTPEQCTAVCETMRENLPRMIKDSKNLHSEFYPLTPEQCSAVYEGIKGEWASMINNSLDFRQLLRYLNPEQCTAVFENMKSDLYKIIQNSDDFDMIMIDEYFTPDQNAELSKLLFSQEHKNKMVDTVHSIQQSNIDKQVSIRESLAKMREGLSSEPEQKQDKDDKHGAESSHDPTP